MWHSFASVKQVEVKFTLEEAMQAQMGVGG
jgi:hypothetical protein